MTLPDPFQHQQQSERLPRFAGIMCFLLSVGLLCWDYGLLEKWEGVSEAVPTMSRDLRVLQSRSVWNQWWEGSVPINTGKVGRSDDAARAAALPSLGEKTLVIYNVHHSSSSLDNLHGENVDFFLKVGVGGESEHFVDYLFLVPPAPAAPLGLKSIEGREKEVTGPPVVIPPAVNVRVLERPQDCLGCSGLQDMLSSSNYNNSDSSSGVGNETVAGLPLTREGLLSRYAHFVFVDSSVRGPFLPRYMHRPRPRRTHQNRFTAPQPTKPWTSVFTDRLSDEIKLVGRSVSCEAELHVQAPVWATDRIGLQLILEQGVLECAMDMETARERHELGATRAVVGAGYGVDCLMLRYQGLNLTRLRQIEVPCMAGDDPSIPLLNDGLPINPLEVVFVLASPHLMASDLPVRRYTDYLLGRGGVKDSEMYTERGQAVLEARRQRLARMVKECNASLDMPHMMSRCPECINHDMGKDGERIFIELYVMAGYDFRFTIEETDVTKLPHHYCESFVRYQAPDVTS
ncbi:hypothetical protein VYU27_000220 [Nannochloropsis oceanica]